MRSGKHWRGKDEKISAIPPNYTPSESHSIGNTTVAATTVEPFLGAP